MDKSVIGMAILRIMSGCLELTAALVMLRLGEVQKALVVNSLLAVVGPFVLFSTTAIGLVGLAERMSPEKFAWVGLGVVCLLVGVLKK